MLEQRATCDDQKIRKEIIASAMNLLAEELKGELGVSHHLISIASIKANRRQNIAH